MPSIDNPPPIGALSLEDDDAAAIDAAPGIEFPPVRREHVLNCSYDRWYPKYKASCVPSTIIPLTDAFTEYLKEDGIILADDEDDDDSTNLTFSSGPAAAATGAETGEWRDTLADPDVRVDKPQPRQDDDDSDSDEEPAVPPNQRFPDLHRQIKAAIEELGGAVMPKLNWSAPKDATWISRHQNSLKCTSPNDIYVLLKSSSFVSHDLDHAFDECVPAPAPSSASTSSAQPLRHVLVLRPFLNPHPAMEFRCFVKHRTFVGATPRSIHYYRFLIELRDAIVARIDDFFERSLRLSFPDDCFVFDVYIPDDANARNRLGPVCLIDINPWAPKTDALLWGWEELLAWEVPKPLVGPLVNEQPRHSSTRDSHDDGTTDDSDSDDADETQGDSEDDDAPGPILRLVEKNDPAGYNFNSAPYSAHKLPKEVVDASAAGSDGMMEFLERWKEMQARGT
jgi:hypothetical protein